MTDTPALWVNGLTRRYGDRVVLNDLNLNVQVGDVYGFLGPNGAGKTTAMRCMLGLIRKDAGEVRVFGEANPTRARRHVGAIIETPAFHEWMSGRDNLRQAAAYSGMSPKEAAREIDRVLERVGLKERARDASGGYSLGMKQRLGIARALLGQPRLLMLDEPTNGLDPIGMREMRDLIRSLALHDRITIFISSHLLSEVEAMCSRVGILRHGVLRAEGSVAELLAGASGTHVVGLLAADMEALETHVDQLPYAQRVGPGGGGRLLVSLDGADATQLNRDLAARGVYLEALVPKSKDLEDVFVEVTQ